MRSANGPTSGACLGRVRRVIEMKSLIATAVVGLCAFAGAGLGISAVVSSNAVASTAIPSGPFFTGGAGFWWVTTPCHPVSCS